MSWREHQRKIRVGEGDHLGVDSETKRRPFKSHRIAQWGERKGKRGHKGLMIKKKINIKGINIERQVNSENQEGETQKEQNWKIACININGLGSREKRAEIADWTKELNLEITGICETHLTYELPRKWEGIRWLGNQREEGERKGGGVGFIMNSGRWEGTELNELTSGRTRNEILWVEGNIERQKWKIGMIYCAHDKIDKKWNEELLKNVRAQLNKAIQRTTEGVILMGDFNAHMMEENQRENEMGKQIEKMAEEFNLNILNMENAEEKTWGRGSLKKTLDYVLVNNTALAWVKRAWIEEGALNSDHNPIIIELDRGRGKQRSQTDQRRQNKIIRGERWIMDSETNWAKYRKTLGELINGWNGEDMEDTERLENRLRETIIEAGKKNILRTSTRKDKKDWLSKETREAIQKRREINRERRGMERTKELEEGGQLLKEVKNRYLEQNEKAKRLVRRDLELRDKKDLDEIKKAGRDGCKKFWEKINMGQKKTTGKCFVTNDGKCIQEKEDIKRELRAWAGEQGMEELRLEKEREVRQKELEKDTATTITVTEVKETIKKLKKGKATGPDEIPAEMIKEGGDVLFRVITKLCNNVCKEQKCPKAWKRSTLTLIPKVSKGTGGSLIKARPITITSVMRKILTGILEKKIRQKIEENEILSEAQAGFRRNRRTTDNIFIIGQCAEAARVQKINLYMAFLDLKKAFDTVDRDLLWDVMAQNKLPPGITQTTMDLYTEEDITLKWGAITIPNLTTQKGLRQGCLLSPLLFILYINEIIKQIEEREWGARVGKEKIPILAYADDLVLMSNNEREMGDMLNAINKVTEDKKLTFNTNKSKIMILNYGRKHETKIWKIGDVDIEETGVYKYLGVKICNDRENIWKEQEREAIRRGKQLKTKILGRAIISYNKYDVGRELWKGVAVPSLTYGNDVMAWRGNNTWEKLDKIQRDLGRTLLGGKKFTAKEAIEGEMGWSNFVARQERNKLLYFFRLSYMKENRLERRVWYENMGIEGTKGRNWTGMVNRIKYKMIVEEDYRKMGNRKVGEKEWRRVVLQKTKQREIEDWKRGMARKTTLQRYQNEKERPKREEIYDNTWGSELIFLARTNSLPVNGRTHFWSGDKTCMGCGAEEESTEHFLLYCEALKVVRDEFWEDWEDMGEKQKLRKLMAFRKQGGEGELRKIKRFWEKMWRRREKLREEGDK